MNYALLPKHLACGTISNPLVEMAAGGPNTAEKIRARLKMELGANDGITPSVMRELAEEREQQVRARY